MLYSTKCNGASDLDRELIIRQMSNFFDQMDEIIRRLTRYSFVIGDSQTKSLIGGFKLFSATRQSICGTRDFRACVDGYNTYQDRQLLVGKIVESFGLSNFDGGEKELILALDKLGNKIVDMAICDALQDEDFSKRSDYGRAEYCDSHGLTEYRLNGSDSVGRSTQRGDDRLDPGVVYRYESNNSHREFEIRRFLDK